MKVKFLALIILSIFALGFIVYIFSIKKDTTAKKLSDNKRITDSTMVITFGGGGLDNGKEVAVDKNGNLYMIGNFQGTVNIGDTLIKATGFYDSFVAKYDSVGTLEWIQTIQSVPTEMMISKNLALDDNGNIYITGQFGRTCTFGKIVKATDFYSNEFIAKYNNNGQIEWIELLQTHGSVDIAAITIDKKGNPYITGSIRDTVNFSNIIKVPIGDVDIFVAKYNANGKAQWVQSAGGRGFDGAASIALDAKNNVYICGSFQNDATFGDKHKSKIMGSDLFVAKYTNKGALEWVESGSGYREEFGKSIVVDDSNYVYVAGAYEDTIQSGDNKKITTAYMVSIKKYSEKGGLLWMKSIKGNGYVEAKKMALDKNGCLFVLGDFKMNANFENQVITAEGIYDNIFISKYDRQGKLKWVKTAGGYAKFLYPNSITTDQNNHVYVLGSFDGRVNFGNVEKTSLREEDVFLWRFIQ